MCRHLNGDPLDNRLCNLKWGTRSENGKDTHIHDTGGIVREKLSENMRGHDLSRYQGRSKLTQEQVLRIRSLKGIKTNAELAKEYGVSRATIGLIQINKNWKWC